MLHTGDSGGGGVEGGGDGGGGDGSGTRLTAAKPKLRRIIGSTSPTTPREHKHKPGRSQGEHAADRVRVDWEVCDESWGALQPGSAVLLFMFILVERHFY